MNFKEVFQKEHVTRKFTNRKVPEMQLLKLLKRHSNPHHCLIHSLGELRY